MSKIAVTVDGQTYEIEVTLPPANETSFNVTVDGHTVPVSVSTLELPAKSVVRTALPQA